jgi:hypothetical protein
MSDQSPNLSNSNFTGGLLGGVLTINGDNTPAQTFAATAPITLTNVANLHTFAITAFGVANKGYVPQTGAAGATDYLAANGTWIPFVGAGVTSLNTRAGAIVLAGSASVIVTEAPANTFTFTAPAAVGLLSLNADVTGAQTLDGLGGVVVTNGGAGAHTVEGPTSTGFAATMAAGTPIPNGVLTPLATHTMGAGTGGTYFIGLCGGVIGVIGHLVDVLFRVNGVTSPYATLTGFIETGGQTCGGGGAGGPAIILAPGDIIDVAVNHHGGALATVSIASAIYGFRIA